MTLILIIFLAELLLSYFADWRNVSVVHRRRRRAVLCDLASSCVSWGIGFIVFVEAKDLRLLIPAVIGSSIGTLLVASRKGGTNA